MIAPCTTPKRWQRQFRGSITWLWIILTTGRIAGLMTTLGFAVAAALATLS
jgi:hypothetical protein